MMKNKLSPMTLLSVLAFFCWPQNKSYCMIHTAQACGGTDVVKKLVSGLTQGTGIQRLAMVDAHGYDCYPAIAALEAGHSSVSSRQVDTKPVEFLA